MIIEIDLHKNVEQNAGVYYDAAKKAKKKLLATKNAIEDLERQLGEAEIKQEKDEKAKEIKKKAGKQEWYEKFRWFYSSEGFFCIGGRDATTNELIMKKHTGKDDVVFHTEMAGSPFFVIKSKDKIPTEKTLKETAAAAASFSKAWKLGVGYTGVFSVKPEQVSKTPMTGEYLKKGSFMIYGRKERYNSELKLAIGIYKEKGKDNDKDNSKEINNEGKPMCGPEDAVASNCEKYVLILPGNVKSSDVAKDVMKKLKVKVHPDEIIRILPAGGCKVGSEAKGR